MLFMMPVLALSDSFTNYTNNYLELDTTTSQGWELGFDSASITSDSLLKNDGSAFKVHVNTQRSPDNRASVSKTISPKNIAAFQTGMGKAYVWYKPTTVTGFTSVKLRLGSDASNYFEYTNSLPFGGSFIAGAQLLTFNLKSPTITVGAPQASSITNVEIITSYSTNQPDFDFTVNRIWVEKNPSSFISTWKVPFYGSKPGGWSLPYTNASEGSGISVTSTDIPSLGEHGRIFYKGEPTSNDPTFTTETSLRIINAKWGARLFFDFVDGFNFSSVFVTNKFDKVGIETYVNNVRTYSQVPFPVVEGKTYKIKYIVNGTNVKVYVDNTYLLQWNVPIRKAGDMGFESYQGTSHFSQFSYS